MKQFLIIFSLLTVMLGTLNQNMVYAWGSVNQAAILQTRYCPQYNRWNNLGRQQKNYIYSAQQAKYYGYRVPETNNTNNGSYYNPYQRGY